MPHIHPLSLTLTLERTRHSIVFHTRGGVYINRVCEAEGDTWAGGGKSQDTYETLLTQVKVYSSFHSPIPLSIIVSG